MAVAEKAPILENVLSSPDDLVLKKVGPVEKVVTENTKVDVV